MPVLVSRNTFEGADPETKLLLIYDMLVDHNALLAAHIDKQDKSCEQRSAECGKRFIKLEKGKKVDAGIAATGGMLGGFIAIICKVRFWP